MSSSQAYTNPGALVGLKMWKVLLQSKLCKDVAFNLIGGLHSFKEHHSTVLK